MSLGTYNSNTNNKKKDFSPTTYSPVKFFNSESSVDPSSLNFAFWKSLLRISITPMKAKLFLQYANDFRKDPNKFTNVGVGTNKGIIYLTSGKNEFGVDSLFVIIKIIDFEHNEILSCAAYEFNRNIFGITDYTEGTSFNQNYDYAQFIEFDMFLDVISSYVSSVNYAIAASVVDNNKYDVSRLSTKITSIQEKLGIDFKKSSGSVNNSSYWNNNGNKNSSANPEHYDNLNQLVDDISSMMVEE